MDALIQERGDRHAAQVARAVRVEAEPSAPSDAVAHADGHLPRALAQPAAHGEGHGVYTINPHTRELPQVNSELTGPQTPEGLISQHPNLVIIDSNRPLNP